MPGRARRIETAVREARAGKTYDEIFAAVAHPAVMPAAAQPPGQPKTYKAVFPAGTPIRGPENAKITIVEYSDFQCPFCGRVEPALKQVVDRYGNDVRIVWRNIPLPFHEHAMDAAEAAFAADAQGKFWPMHDKLFANQGALDRPSIDKYAADIGLDMAKYKAAMDGHTYKSKIDADMKDGAAAGVNSTPSFFINGQMLSGAQPFPAFKSAIDAELAKANALVAAGGLRRRSCTTRSSTRWARRLPRLTEGRAMPSGKQWSTPRCLPSNCRIMSVLAKGHWSNR